MGCRKNSSNHHQYSISAIELRRKTFYPAAVTLEMIPKIAFAPLCVTWLGFGFAPNGDLPEYGGDFLYYDPSLTLNDNRSLTLGDVKNFWGLRIGSLEQDGSVYNFLGMRRGEIEPDGTVRNRWGWRRGFVDQDGAIYGFIGFKLGSVSADGTVRNLFGFPRGWVEPTGNLVQMGGAARLLLLRSR